MPRKKPLATTLTPKNKKNKELTTMNTDKPLLNLEAEASFTFEQSPHIYTPTHLQKHRHIYFFIDVCFKEWKILPGGGGSCL